MVHTRHLESIECRKSRSPSGEQLRRRGAGRELERPVELVVDVGVRVDAQRPVERGGEIRRRRRPVLWILAEAVGGPVEQPLLDAAPGQDNRVTVWPVVPARGADKSRAGFGDFRLAAELG